MPELTKKQKDVLDYRFDFAPLTNGRGISDWLQPGEQIASYLVTVEDGLTLDSQELQDAATAVIAWLSGGTPGVGYVVQCEITTTSIPPRTKLSRFDLRVIGNF